MQVQFLPCLFALLSNLITFALIGFLPFCTIIHFNFRSILQPGNFSDVQTNFTYEETVRLVSKCGW